jgi:GNAT superfamily N-acetyltransferase
MTRNFLAAYGDCSTPENIAATVASTTAWTRSAGSSATAAPEPADGARGAIAGHAQLRFGGDAPRRCSPARAEIARFYVDTAFHGRGLAQQMMAEVRRLAAAHGARSLWLSCWQEQPAGDPLLRQGRASRIAGSLVFEVGDDPKDDWLMVAELLD